MSDLKTIVGVTDNGSGSFTVNYEVFTLLRKYSEGSVTKTQISSYNSSNQDIPGVKVDVVLVDEGFGTALTFSSSFNISSPLVIDEDKPFVEVNYWIWNETLQANEKRGHVIMRGHVPN